MLRNSSPQKLATPALSWLLAALTGLSAASVDLCLPALPQIAAALQISAEQAQLLVSLFLLGNGLSLLPVGPLSDHFGRRPVLLGGLLLYSVSSLLCPFAQNFPQLLVLRIVQGAGVSVGPVMARAVVRDLFDAQQGAKILASITTVFSLAPMLAPMLGAVLLRLFSYHMMFWVLTLFGGGMLWMVYFYLPESKPNLAKPMAVWPAFFTFFKSQQAFGYAMLLCLGFSAKFSYIVCSPYILISVMGLSSATFSLAFAGNAVFLGLGAMTNHRLKWRPAAITRLGLQLAGLGGLVMLACGIGQINLLPLLLLGMFTVFFGFGIADPTITAAAMAPVPHIAGVASALLGGIQLASGSAAAALTGSFMVHNAYVLHYLVAGCSLGCVLWFEWLQRAQRIYGTT